jgi:hypothetical protein
VIVQLNVVVVDSKERRGVFACQSVGQSGSAQGGEEGGSAMGGVGGRPEAKVRHTTHKELSPTASSYVVSQAKESNVALVVRTPSLLPELIACARLLQLSPTFTLGLGSGAELLSTDLAKLR